MEKGDVTSPSIQLHFCSFAGSLECLFHAVTCSNIRQSRSKQRVFACICMCMLPTALHRVRSIRMEADVFPESLQLPLCRFGSVHICLHRTMSQKCGPGGKTQGQVPETKNTQVGKVGNLGAQSGEGAHLWRNLPTVPVSPPPDQYNHQSTREANSVW